MYMLPYGITKPQWVTVSYIGLTSFNLNCTVMPHWFNILPFKHKHHYVEINTGFCGLCPERRIAADQTATQSPHCACKIVDAVRDLTFNWRVALLVIIWSIGWGIPQLQCIPGSCDQWEFLPFSIGHWQSFFTALMAGKYLPLRMCKEPVKESTLEGCVKLGHQDLCVCYCPSELAMASLVYFLRSTRATPGYPHGRGKNLPYK